MNELTELLIELKDVLESSTRLNRWNKAHLYFKPDAKFRSNKARPVP